MRSRYIMYKDIPVARSYGYDVEILDFDKLPFALRTRDLDFDMIYHGWTESRIMNIGRTNAKAILNSLGLSSKNLYVIGEILHFVQFTDCYWMKSDDEDISWADVSPYTNSLTEQLSNVSLTGQIADLRHLVTTDHLNSPDLGAQGMSAKCLVKEDDLYLYKVSRREIAASELLDKLGFAHVRYSIATPEQLDIVADKARQDKIREKGEIVARCKIISNEDLSLLSWGDFCTYCDLNDKDPYEELSRIPGIDRFHEMNIADYIIGNNDRHVDNWGFTVEDFEITGIHPLMDHDHAFSNEALVCQTMDKPMSLYEAAKVGLENIDWTMPKQLEKPKLLTSEEWSDTKTRLKAVADIIKEMHGHDLELSLI